MLLHIDFTHRHPFAFAQANNSTDTTNCFRLSGAASPFPASGKPRDTIAASHGLPTRESSA
jgi:hypothetical protein